MPVRSDMTSLSPSLLFADTSEGGSDEVAKL